MAGDRVDSFSEAKKLYREHRPAGRPDERGPDLRAGAVSGYQVAGTNRDGIVADFDALVLAERELAALHDDLFAQLRSATALSGPLGDGSSPVSAHMRAAFLDRAGDEGGVRTALVDYIEELFAVRTAIVRTLRTYEGVDGEAAERLNRQLTQFDQEVGR